MLIVLSAKSVNRFNPKLWLVFAMFCETLFRVSLYCGRGRVSWYIDTIDTDRTGLTSALCYLRTERKNKNARGANNTQGDIDCTKTSSSNNFLFYMFSLISLSVYFNLNSTEINVMAFLQPNVMYPFFKLLYPSFFILTPYVIKYNTKSTWNNLTQFWEANLIKLYSFFLIDVRLRNFKCKLVYYCKKKHLQNLLHLYAWGMVAYIYIYIHKVHKFNIICSKEQQNNIDCALNFNFKFLSNTSI